MDILTACAWGPHRGGALPTGMARQVHAGVVGVYEAP